MKFDTLTSTLEEKKGLWDNMHARRKAGKPKRKPGDKNYPKTLNVEETCGKGEYFCNDDQKCKPIPEGTKVKSNGELVSEGEAWTRKEGQNKEGGLNEKGRKSYERANPGSDLKAPSKKKGNKRRASFCARMKGMRKRQKPSNNTGEDRLSKSLRAWNCSYEWELDLLEDAKMGKQSDDKLAAAHKKFSGMDQSSPANKFMLKRISKEMDRRKKMNEHHQKDEDGNVIEHEDTPDMEIINPKQPWDKLEEAPRPEEEMADLYKEAKVDKMVPDHKRSGKRLERYGNPHGSLALGGGIQRDRRADHAAKRGVKTKGMKEEIENLDELSKKTMGSYVKKASKDIYHRGALAYGMDAPRKMEKSRKRMKGIDRATDKITKEEVEMTRKAYNKIHKDFKSDDPKKPRTTKYVPGKGTVSMPVKFVDEGMLVNVAKGVESGVKKFNKFDDKVTKAAKKKVSKVAAKAGKNIKKGAKKVGMAALRGTAGAVGGALKGAYDGAKKGIKKGMREQHSDWRNELSEKIKYDKSGSSMDYFLGPDPKKTKYYKDTVKKKTKNEGMYDIDPKTGESPVASKVKAANKLPDKKRLKSLAKLSKEMIGEKKMVKVKLNPKKKIGVKVTDIGPGGKEYVRKDTMGEGTSYGIFKGDGMSFPERMKAKAKKEKEKKKKLVKAEDYFVGTVRDTRWNSDHLDEVLGYAAQIAGGMVRDGVRGLDNPDIKPGKDTVKKLKTQAAEKKQTGGASAVKSQQDAKRQAALKKQKEDRRDRAKNIMTAEKAAKKKVKQSDTGQSLRDGEAGGAPNMKPITTESYSSKPSNIIKKAKLSAALDRLQALKVQSKMKKEEMGHIAHSKTKKGGKTIYKVNKNDEADAQKAMKNDPKYILGKTRVQPYKEEVKRDEYGDPIGGPKISKKQLKKNLSSNEKDEKIVRSEQMDPKPAAGGGKPMTKGQEKQIEGKKKQQNMIKKQILMKKLMAVRAGADGVAS